MPTHDIERRQPGHAPAAQPTTPAWRRILRYLTAAITIGFVFLIGVDASATFRGGDPLPAMVQDMATAITAVLWVGVGADFLLDRNLAVCRQEIAARDAAVAALDRRLDRIVEAMADLADRVGERLDSEYLTGSQDALDAVDSTANRVVPIGGRPGAQRRSTS